MSTTPFTPTPNSGPNPGPDPADDPARLVLDPDAVAFVLYLTPFTVADWRGFGPVFWARYVYALTTDPRAGVAELVTRALAADRAGVLPVADPCRLATARRYAHHVVAAHAAHTN